MRPDEEAEFGIVRFARDHPVHRGLSECVASRLGRRFAGDQDVGRLVEIHLLQDLSLNSEALEVDRGGDEQQVDDRLFITDEESRLVDILNHVGVGPEPHHSEGDRSKGRVFVVDHEDPRRARLQRRAASLRSARRRLRECIGGVRVQQIRCEYLLDVWGWRR